MKFILYVLINTTLNLKLQPYNVSGIILTSRQNWTLIFNRKFNLLLKCLTLAYFHLWLSESWKFLQDFQSNQLQWYNSDRDVQLFSNKHSLLLFIYCGISSTKYFHSLRISRKGEVNINSGLYTVPHTVYAIQLTDLYNSNSALTHILAKTWATE
jgi:hypothetical protein